MEKHPDAKQFQMLAGKLLNNTLRSYTARWHRWMTTSEALPGMPQKTMKVFHDEQVRRLFRTELIELQHDLVYYLEALRALAAGQAIPIETKQTIDSFDVRKPNARLGKEMAAGLPLSLADINAKEHEDLLERRRNLNCPLAEKPLRNATGLGLSGGGIRSATFCLGIVQTLARRNLFHHFDYLSTVSGGGYLGTFLSSALKDDSPSDQSKSAKEIIDQVLKTPQVRRESKAIRHLRNSSKYLGTGGVEWMAGLMVFGIAINLLLLLPVPLFFAVGVYWAQYFGFWEVSQNSAALWTGLQPNVAGQVLSRLLTLLIGTAFVLPFVQSITQGKQICRFRQVWESVTLTLAIALLIFGAVYLLPEIVNAYTDLKAKLPAVWQMFITAVLPFLLAQGTKLLEAWKRVQKLVLALFALSGPMFFLIVFLVVSSHLGIGSGNKYASHLALPIWISDMWPSLNQHADTVRIFMAALLLLVWGWYLVNINTVSPHRYYRNRLCDCYLIKRNNGKIEARTELPLSQLFNSKKAAPYHLINTTVNLTTSKNPELRGRNGDFFAISKHYCGSPVTGYHPTATVVDKNPHVDLGSAMAISGAAASTGMGWQSMANFRFLLGVLNIRLGYWLYNPERSMICKYLQGPGPWYLYKEIFGWMKETDRYLNLSDGGHIENLAVYELLRRKCKFIVCIDGGQESGMECADLVRLQRYAEIDLGIRFEYDIADLQLDENRLSRAYAVLVKVIYADPEQDPVKADWSAAEPGWMLYIKLAITGSEPAYVTDYRRENPAFPHQTTADQFFDEAQFEAYRMLGECAAESLFRNEIVGTVVPDNLQDWFQALANNLLRDNDAVF